MPETDEQRQARWAREDRIARQGADQGNPYATLCTNCMGRHWAPKDRECPRPKFER